MTQAAVKKKQISEEENKKHIRTEIAKHAGFDQPKKIEFSSNVLGGKHKPVEVEKSEQLTTEGIIKSVGDHERRIRERIAMYLKKEKERKKKAQKRIEKIIETMDSIQAQHIIKMHRKARKQRDKDSERAVD